MPQYLIVNIMPLQSIKAVTPGQCSAMKKQEIPTHGKRSFCRHCCLALPTCATQARWTVGLPPAQDGAMGLRCFWNGDSGVLWGIKNIRSDTNQK